MFSNLSIATKPRVNPLFCGIDQPGNKTSLSMRCPTGAIFSLSLGILHVFASAVVALLNDAYATLTSYSSGTELT